MLPFSLLLWKNAASLSLQVERSLSPAESARSEKETRFILISTFRQSPFNKLTSVFSSPGWKDFANLSARLRIILSQRIRTTRAEQSLAMVFIAEDNAVNVTSRLR